MLWWATGTICTFIAAVVKQGLIGHVIPSSVNAKIMMHAKYSRCNSSIEQRSAKTLVANISSLIIANLGLPYPRRMGSF